MSLALLAGTKVHTRLILELLLAPGNIDRVSFLGGGGNHGGTRFAVLSTTLPYAVSRSRLDATTTGAMARNASLAIICGEIGSNTFTVHLMLPM